MNASLNVGNVDFPSLAAVSAVSAARLSSARCKRDTILCSFSVVGPTQVCKASVQSASSRPPVLELFDCSETFPWHGGHSTLCMPEIKINSACSRPLSHATKLLPAQLVDTPVVLHSVSFQDLLPPQHSHHARLRLRLPCFMSPRQKMGGRHSYCQCVASHTALCLPWRRPNLGFPAARSLL